MSLERETANGLVESAIGLGAEKGIPYSVAVVDGAGFLAAFQRASDGRINTVDLAVKKARTAARWERPTRMVRRIVLPGEMGYGIQHTDPDICIVQGGLPVVDGGEVIGAIGTSGGPVDDDLELCEHALSEHDFPADFDSPV